MSTCAAKPGAPLLLIARALPKPYSLPMRQPIQVAIYCFAHVADGWRVLMLHRIPENFPIWQGVTGGVEDDESPMTAARREFGEETGFTPRFFEQIDHTYTFPLDDRWRSRYDWTVDEMTEHVFVALMDHTDAPTLSPHEHDEFRWCTMDEALELMYWESNKESLLHCLRHLETRRAD